MKKTFLILSLLSLTGTALGADWTKTEWGKFDYDFEEKPWAELEAQLPPLPKQENLLPFFVSAVTKHRFFVDGASITPGPDGVVRYILVIETGGGATNVSFEGMRCSAGEVKRYAFGRSSGDWGKARNAQWEKIEYKDVNRHHHTLFDDFLCPRGFPVASREEAVKALKQGIHPTVTAPTW